MILCAYIFHLRARNLSPADLTGANLEGAVSVQRKLDGRKSDWDKA
jgi:hypothetical protein